MNNKWTFLSWPCEEELRVIENSKSNPYLGYVYVIEWNNIVKIGCTQKPLKRIKNLFGYSNYAGVKFGRIAISTEHSNYTENERKLHEFFSNERIQGTELFNVSFTKVFELLPDIAFELKTESEEEIEKRIEVFKKIVGCKSEQEAIEELSNDVMKRPELYMHEICSTISKYYYILDMAIDIYRNINNDPGLVKYLEEYPEDHYIIDDCI